MQRIRWRAGLMIAAFGIAACSGLGCARRVPPDIPAGEDPLDRTHIVSFDSTSRLGRRIEVLPRSAYKRRWWFLDHLAPRRVLPRPPRFAAGLTGSLAVLPSSNLVQVVVTFRDTVRIPVFPRLKAGLPHTTLQDSVLLDATRSLIQSLRSRRALAYERDTLALKRRFSMKILGNSWLVQACLVELPAGQVASLTDSSIAESTHVVFARPEIGQRPPDDDGDDGNDVIVAREAIGSDHYFDRNPDPGRLALLDTGVMTTHRLLCSPSHIFLVANLNPPEVGTDLPPDAPSPQAPDCSTPGGGDTDEDGHGTSTAAILTGNGNDVPPHTGNGLRFRGVTRDRLDSFNVYDQSDDRFRTLRVVKAFELAMARLDPVIVAEVAAEAEPGVQPQNDPDVADISAAAEHAYEAGFAVLAANGNRKSRGVAAPARARRTLGVGAYNLLLHVPEGDRARDPGEDRVKPDLLGPTGMETAGKSTGSGAANAAMRPHGATSGATPFAAGAASLLRGWMSEGWGPPDPGQLYSMLLLSGSRDGPFVRADSEGVGLIRLPTSGQARYGKVWVSSAIQSLDVPIEIPASAQYSRLSAAIWWPEVERVSDDGAISDTHNDIDLEIVSPGWFGTTRAKSDGIGSVFERTHVDGSPLATGTWILRIHAYTMRTGPQVVYWAAALTP